MKRIIVFTLLIILLYYIKVNYKNYKFNKDGYLKIKNVLSKDECNLLWKEIMHKWQINKMEAHRLNIHPIIGKRKDLLMDFRGVNRFILKKVYNKYKYILEKHFGTDNIGIHEYSCIICYPRTEKQWLHRDGFELKYKELVVFGILLSDVTKEMGPTEIHIGSNKLEFNVGKSLEHISKNKKNIFYGTGKIGDLIIWEGFTIHGGSANISNNIRPVLIMTFINLDSEFGKNMDMGSAIHPRFRNMKLSLL